MTPKMMIMAAIVAGAMGTGCTTRIGDFTALSTKNVKITGKKGKTVKGVSCDRSLLGIPFERKDMKVATDRALESAGVDYDVLVDVRIDTNWMSALFYGENCIEISGTAMASASAPD